jgi:hypothetical protein
MTTALFGALFLILAEAELVDIVDVAVGLVLEVTVLVL